MVAVTGNAKVGSVVFAPTVSITLPAVGAITHGSQVNASNVGLLVSTTRTIAGKAYETAADFTAANGVVSGSGTQASPWVIDRVRFTSDVIVGSWDPGTLSGKYVKFTNCRFEGNPTSTTQGGSAYLSAIRPYGPAQIEITDSTAGPLAGPGANVGVDKGFQSYVPLVVRRCNIFGACILYYVEGEPNETGWLLEDSYLHHIWSSAGDHTDIVNGNFHCSHVTVQRCYLDGIRTGNTYVTNAFGIYNDPDVTISDWTIRSNYVTRAATYILGPTSTAKFAAPLAIEDNIVTTAFSLQRSSVRTPTSQGGNRDENGSPITF